MWNQTLSLYCENGITFMVCLWYFLDSPVSELMGNGEGEVEAVVLGYYALPLGAAGAT